MLVITNLGCFINLLFYFIKIEFKTVHLDDIVVKPFKMNLKKNIKHLGVMRLIKKTVLLDH